jgi:hypothetical protein
MVTPIGGAVPVHPILSSAGRGSIVDEYGALDRDVQAFSPKLRRHKELGSVIRSWFDTSDPEREYLAEGALYNVQVSACANERQVTSWPRVYRILGKTRFLELARITLKLLERNIPEELHAKFIEIKPTGSRRLEPVSRSPIVMRSPRRCGSPAAVISDERAAA